jgi:thioredoxin 1
MKFHYIKSTIAFLPVLLCSYGCFSVRNTENFTYSKLDPAAYDSLLKNTSGHYLIDVRTKKEHSKEHIDGAVNYSYLAFHFRRDVKNLDRNKPVFVYCQTCHRSPLAAKKLKHMGFSTVYDLKGGYQKWNPEN